MPLPIALITSATTLIGKAMDLFGDDDKAQAQALLKQLEFEQQNVQSQLEINKTEAAHRSLFVAGWRPCFGWIGAIACGFDWIVRPMLPYVWEGAPAIPPMDNDLMWTVITGMLGLGGLRSYEKQKNVAR